MHDGWESVLAAYGLVAAVLVVWFWMILGKLRRNPVRRDEVRGAATRGRDE